MNLDKDSLLATIDLATPACLKMGSKYMPYANEDDLANNWGTNLVEVHSRAPEVSFRAFDSEVRKEVPGFRVTTICACGSAANEWAISMTTGGDLSCLLIPQGSYVAGMGPIEKLSTQKPLPNWLLALVVHPDEATEEARLQTIAFPYHVPNEDLSDEDLEKREKKCLISIESKIILSKLRGCPIKALLMEFILTGCGGELTTRFLLSLATLMKKFRIGVIADEVMTAGRVGPSFAMTSSLPTEFQECVHFITVGKALGIGMVLERADKDKSYGFRGTSTEIEVSEPCQRFLTICDRIKTGVIERKERKVLAALKVDKDNNEHWGHGLMAFSDTSLSAIQRNLKCRHLAQLEDNPKTKICSRRAKHHCKWTRKTVNAHLMERMDQWLLHSIEYEEQQHDSPYTPYLASLLQQNPNQVLFFPEQLLDHIPESESPQLLAEYRQRRKKRLGSSKGRCSKKHKSMVFDVMSKAAATSYGFLSPSQKQHKRRICYVVSYDNEDE